MTLLEVVVPDSAEPGSRALRSPPLKLKAHIDPHVLSSMASCKGSSTSEHPQQDQKEAKYIDSIKSISESLDLCVR